MKAGWLTRKLGEVCEIYQPKTISTKEMNENGKYPVFGANGIIGRYDKFNHEEPQLLVTCRGATCGAINISEPNSWITGNAMVIRPKGKELSLEFLTYIFRWILNISKAITGAAQPQITRTNLAPLEISYPASVGEQQRIVAILDEAFDGIATATANAEKNLDSSRELFERTLQSVFTEKQEGWLEKPLGELCERITKGSSPRWQGIAYVEKPGILFVTSENVGEYKLLMETPKYVEEKFNIKDKKSILKKGDVLTNIVGASIGRTAIFNLDEVANINQAVCLIRCKPSLLHNCYLTYLLNSPILKQILHDNEVNNARANLSLTFFSQLAVPLPPITKQKAIAKQLDELYSETKQLESIYQRKRTALNELKQSILHQAFSGQLH